MPVLPSPTLSSHFRSLPILLLFALCFVLTSASYSQDVLTYHNSNSRVGLTN